MPQFHLNNQKLKSNNTNDTYWVYNYTRAICQERNLINIPQFQYSAYVLECCWPLVSFPLDVIHLKPKQQ